MHAKIIVFIKTMAKSSFKSKFIAKKGDKDELRKLIETSDEEEIAQLILEKANEPLGFTVWTSVLSLLSDEEKLFEVIKDVSRMQASLMN